MALTLPSAIPEKLDQNKAPIASIDGCMYVCVCVIE